MEGKKKKEEGRIIKERLFQTYYNSINWCGQIFLSKVNVWSGSSTLNEIRDVFRVKASFNLYVAKLKIRYNKSKWIFDVIPKSADYCEDDI